MIRKLLPLAALVAAVAIVASACGGSSGSIGIPGIPGHKTVSSNPTEAIANWANDGGLVNTLGVATYAITVAFVKLPGADNTQDLGYLCGKAKDFSQKLVDSSDELPPELAGPIRDEFTVWVQAYSLCTNGDPSTVDAVSDMIKSAPSVDGLKRAKFLLTGLDGGVMDGIKGIRVPSTDELANDFGIPQGQCVVPHQSGEECTKPRPTDNGFVTDGANNAPGRDWQPSPNGDSSTSQPSSTPSTAVPVPEKCRADPSQCDYAFGVDADGNPLPAPSN